MLLIHATAEIRLVIISALTQWPVLGLNTDAPIVSIFELVRGSDTAVDKLHLIRW